MNVISYSRNIKAGLENPRRNNMAAEYTEENVPVTCPECETKLEGIPVTEQHILESHGYTPQEAKFFARLWADSASEENEAHDVWRTEEYRRTGVDPENPPSDRDPL